METNVDKDKRRKQVSIMHKAHLCTKLVGYIEGCLFYSFLSVGTCVHGGQPEGHFATPCPSCTQPFRSRHQSGCEHIQLQTHLKKLPSSKFRLHACNNEEYLKVYLHSIVTFNAGTSRNVLCSSTFPLSLRLSMTCIVSNLMFTHTLSKMIAN